MSSFFKCHWFKVLIALPIMGFAIYLSFVHQTDVYSVIQGILNSESVIPYSSAVNDVAIRLFDVNIFNYNMAIVLFLFAVALFLVTLKIIFIIIAFSINQVLSLFGLTASEPDILEKSKIPSNAIDFPDLNEIKNVITLSGYPSSTYGKTYVWMHILMVSGIAAFVVLSFMYWIGSGADLLLVGGLFVAWLFVYVFIAKAASAPIKNKLSQILENLEFSVKNNFININSENRLHFNTATGLMAYVRPTKMHVFPYRLLREWNYNDVVESRVAAYNGAVVGSSKTIGSDLTLLFDDPDFPYIKIRVRPKEAEDFHAKLSAIANKF